ncbi:dihydrodipicolinate synthase family protein [Microbacterium sp. GCS4]|uniref:dihydrodipicolinate synthase family protein n=1 Tax=Microbacterium sp. GCS4 TaxID=1692239 RepID=UPI0006814D7D|nr:dihydrodipicolinate synthase family protein [Microbacterium sp. GCS4]KNY04834.1 dihydrodipicolinate synthase [Microbacterium sp. GCS4]
MFTGLSAFPLTPFRDDRLDAAAFGDLVEWIARAGVDSIGALGSTGSYAYLTAAERAEAARVAVAAAGDVPVIVGVGAVSTRDVLTHVDSAQRAGAAGLLLAPVTYQPLTDGEVYGLYERASADADIPIVVYDNPATTGVRFTDDLYASIARLPHVASIKIPALPDDEPSAEDRVRQLHELVPGVTIGISGDAAGARGLIAGCEAWYSVLAGILPDTCLAITRAAQSGDVPTAMRLSEGLAPVWALFDRHGSYRVAAAIAAERGLVVPEAVHHPVQPLRDADREAVRTALAGLGVVS